MKAPNRQIVIYSSILVSTFVWIGFVCAISFMEAWLKFRAPNVSLSTGLSIGKLIFSALNKVEWILGGISITAAFLDNHSPKLVKSPFLVIPILILVLQTFWLLPSLNERADIIIHGLNTLPSSVHFYYLILEFAKIFLLFMLGTSVVYRLTNVRKEIC